MPLDILSTILFEGTDSVPGWDYIKTVGPALLAVGATKYYFGGTNNTWERELHGKVFIVTGGTSGMGSELVHELATKGAQVVMLVSSITQWTVEHIDDLRESTNNFLIYAEECDLSSLYSVRKFATKWIDNNPPRRLDGVVCLAADAIPLRGSKQLTQDGVESQIGINYLAHFHLLTLLSPSLRVQPPDRDVRVVVATCSSHALGDIDLQDPFAFNKPFQPLKVYGTSKLLLGLFCKHFQVDNDLYERKDKHPNNIRVNFVNPGLMRSPGTRRFLSFGSIFGLFLYMLMYPIYWLFLKSCIQGCQSFLFTLISPVIPKINGGNYIQECKINTNLRKEYLDAELVQKIYAETEALIKKLETESAIERKKNESKDGDKKSESTEGNEKVDGKGKKGKGKGKGKGKVKSTSKEISNSNANKVGITSSSEPLFPNI